MNVRTEIRKEIERGDKMGDVSMSGKGRLTQSTACKVACEPKKLSCWKRLWTFIKVLLYKV